MRVFVTGATGFIGTAFVGELLGSGHRVLGLVRSEASAAQLCRLGAEPILGNIEDRAALNRGLERCDGAVHLAMSRDFSDLKRTFATDRKVIETLGAALANSGRPLIVPNGTMVLTPGQVGTEVDPGSTESAASFRVEAEQVALDWATRDVRACVVRLAPAVHGEGDHHGFIPMVIALARKIGRVLYIGDGSNRWPAVHRLDAAHLLRLALETGMAGHRYHCAGEDGIAFKDIAIAVGKGLSLPVMGVSLETAVEELGWAAHILAADNPVSTAMTRTDLHWRPTHPGLLEDLQQRFYFEQRRTEA